MRLDELIGQSRAVAVLRNAIRRDRIAHAYLFFGPDGVGKSAAALAFAQALNCEDESRADAQDACGSCRSCQLIARGNHPDVRVVSLARDRSGKLRTEISIGQIRQDPREPYTTPRPLIQDAYLKPAIARHKVYVIDPADRLSGEAANALLHVLEEPPPHVVSVLVSTHRSRLLPTVVSRCQQVAFELVGTQLIENHLLGLGIDPGLAASLARVSGGRVAWAVRATRRPEVLAARDALLELCADLPRRPVAASLRVAEQIRQQAQRLAESRAGEDEDEEADSTEAGDDPRPSLERALREELPWCLDVIASWYRDVLAAGHGGTVLNADREAAVASTSGADRAGAEGAVEAVLAARRHIERNANIDLTLESLAIRLLGGG